MISGEHPRARATRESRDTDATLNTISREGPHGPGEQGLRIALAAVGVFIISLLALIIATALSDGRRIEHVTCGSVIPMRDGSVIVVECDDAPRSEVGP